MGTRHFGLKVWPHLLQVDLINDHTPLVPATLGLCILIRALPSLFLLPSLPHLVEDGHFRTHGDLLVPERCLHVRLEHDTGIWSTKLQSRTLLESINPLEELAIGERIQGGIIWRWFYLGF